MRDTRIFLSFLVSVQLNCRPSATMLFTAYICHLFLIMLLKVAYLLTCYFIMKLVMCFDCLDPLERKFKSHNDLKDSICIYFPEFRFCFSDYPSFYDIEKFLLTCFLNFNIFYFSFFHSLFSGCDDNTSGHYRNSAAA